jgi:hypothetical protein
MLPFSFVLKLEFQAGSFDFLHDQSGYFTLPASPAPAPQQSTG